MLRLLSALFLIFISLGAHANTELNCISKNYSVNAKYGTYAYAKKRVPIMHSHTVFDNEIIYKIDDKIIKRAPVSFGDYDDTIVGIYNFKTKHNLKFTYFKKTKKFNFQIIGKGSNSLDKGSIWGTCEISTLSTKNADEDNFPKKIDFSKEKLSDLSSSQLARANIQLNCTSSDYRKDAKYSRLTVEMVKSRVPLKHSHFVINNEIIYKIDNQIIKKAPVSFGDYDDKIVGIYKFKTKRNLHFTYFKTTQKFNINISNPSQGSSVNSIWGTCEIVKLNTHKKKVIASKPEIKKQINSSKQFEQEKQKRIELEKKLAALEKQKKEQQSNPKTIIATNPKSEFPLQPIPLDFPSVSLKRDDIAVIIGNANYKKMGKDIPNVNPAYADAEGIKQYFMKAKGIKEGNIIYLKDATGSQLLGVFGNDKSHKGKLFNYIKPYKSNVYIYYAGHGAPGKEGDAYLVPTDTDSQTIEFTGYPLSTLYSNLGKLPTKSMTVILEACFSGGSQSGSLISRASPILIQPKKTFIPNNIKVIAAGSERQMASWEEDSSHSLFTKYFLKAMSGEGDINKDGKVSDTELREYLSDTMTYYARRYYGRDQKVQIHNGG